MEHKFCSSLADLYFFLCTNRICCSHFLQPLRLQLLAKSINLKDTRVKCNIQWLLKELDPPLLHNYIESIFSVWKSTSFYVALKKGQKRAFFKRILFIQPIGRDWDYLQARKRMQIHFDAKIDMNFFKGARKSREKDLHSSLCLRMFSFLNIDLKLL